MNEQNLKHFTKENAAENGRKGGSSPKRKATIKAKNLMKMYLASKPEISEESLKSLKKLGVDVDDPNITSNMSLMMAIIVSRAHNGDMDAVKMALEMAGDIVTARDAIAKEQLELEREKLRLMQDQKSGGQSDAPIINIITKHDSDD